MDDDEKGLELEDVTVALLLTLIQNAIEGS